MRKKTKTFRTTGKIKVGIQCPACKDIIFSLYQQDFRRCMCGKVFVDGGDDRLRWGAEPPVQPSDVINVYRPQSVAEKLMSRAVRSKLPAPPPPMSYFSSNRERYQFVWHWDEWHWPAVLGAYPGGGFYRGAIYGERYVIGPLEIRRWADSD